MTNAIPPIAAVLTGDLIGSTDPGPDRIERSMEVLATQAALLNAAIGSETRFTRFRGDGWQILLRQPNNFLWVTVYMSAVLRADPDCLPSRIAIGLGSVDRLGQTGLSAANGTAFINSGRVLDTMTGVGQRLGLAGDGSDEIQRSTLAFIDDRIAGWSREQAEVVALRLRPQSRLTLSKMAAELQITRQAVSARLKAAGWDLIDGACAAFIHHYQALGIRHV